MGFLGTTGRVHPDVRERWELETVARMRRVGAHPSFEAATIAFNLVLARMANEMKADADGNPAPFPTVETSIKQVLQPLERGAGEAGLGKVYPTAGAWRAALENWATSGAFEAMETAE